MRTVRQMQNFTASIVRYLLTFVFSFYTRRLFIDHLGVEYLGVAGLMGNVLNMLGLAELGIGSSIVFSLYSPIATGNQHKVHLLIHLYRCLYNYIGLVIAVLGLALMPFLTDIAPGLAEIPHYNLIYILFLLQAVIPYFFAYNSTLYTASQQDYKLQNIRTIFYLISVACTVAVLKLYPDYILLVCCMVILGILPQLIIFVMARRRWPWISTKPSGRLDADDTATIKKNVKALVLHKLGDYCVNSTSGLIVANAVSLVAVGFMVNYSSVSSLLKSLVTQFFSAMTAGMGELVATAPKEKIHAVFGEMNFLAFWFFGATMMGFFFCADGFIDLWLGEGLNLPRAAVFFLAAEIYVTGMRIPPYVLQSAAGLYANDRYAPLVQSIVNLAVGIVTARIWGVTGVTFAVLFSGLVVPSWFRPYVIYRDFFNRSFRIYGGIFALYAFMLVVGLILTEVIYRCYSPEPGVANVLYRAAVAMAVFHAIVSIAAVCCPQGRAAFRRFRRILNQIYEKYAR